jgi:APA family basic amino acid/polyamine antiporter
LVPLLGAASCLYLALSLPWLTWLRFGLWLAAGLAIYVYYSRHHSALAAQHL